MDYIEKLFTRWGHPQTTSDIDIRLFLTRPDRLVTPEIIAANDKTAAEYIARLEIYVETLKEYRSALAARYGQIETMAYHDELTIKREKRDSVSFSISIHRIFEDGTQKRLLSEKYTGKDRAKALKRFEELKKQHPGITAIMDIEKGKWEK